MYHLLTVCHAFTVSWQKMPSGPAVAGHATAVQRDRIWSFGGLTHGISTDTLWKFDGSQWEMLELGERPPKRMYASLSNYGDEGLCLAGGWDPAEPGSGGVFHNDLWIYNISTQIWTKSLQCLKKPTSRHVSVHLQDKGLILIHTFWNNNSVLLFDPVADTLVEQETTGECPNGFSMQSAGIVGNKMILFGGSTRNQYMTSDTFILDLKTWTWTRKVSDPCLTSRASASMGVINDTCIIYSGGTMGQDGLTPLPELLMSNISHDTKWNIEQTTGPPPRVASALLPLRNNFFVFGGWSPKTFETFSDVWMMVLE